MATFSVQLPDGTILKDIPEGTTQKQIKERFPEAFGATQPSQKTPEQRTEEIKDASVTKEAAKAVGRGVLSTGALIKEGLPAVFKAGAEQVFGGDWGGQEQTEKLVNALNTIENDPRLKSLVGSWEDVDSPKAAALYMANAAQIIPDLAGGLATGALVKGGVKTALSGVGKKLGKKGAAAAFGAGVAGYNQAVLTPSEQASIYAETQEVRPDLALGSAAIQNVGETLSDLFIVGKLGAPLQGRGLSSLTKAAGRGAVVEGTTEFGQGLVSEAAQEIANPEKATFNAPIDEALLGAIGGGTIRGATQLIAPDKAVSNQQPTGRLEERPVYTPSEMEIEVASTVPTEVAKKAAEITTQTPKAEDLSTTSSVSQPAKSPAKTPTSAQQRPTPASLADEIRKEMGRTSDPVAKTPTAALQAPSQSKFNLYSNVNDTEGLRYRDYVKSSLDLVGFDEDVVYFDPSKNDDESWFGLEMVAPGVAKYRNQIQEFTQKNNTLGAAVQFKADDGTLKHLFFVNRGATTSEPEKAKAFIHEGLGHTIANRFMLRDPEVRDGFINLVRQKLQNKGLGDEGLSFKDVADLVSSWSFNNDGSFIDASTGKLDTRFNFRPIYRGARTDVTLPAEAENLQYMTAVDEVMAEQVARWFQTDEKPLTVLDKFFKTIADIYRKFFETAKEKGLLPWKEVSDFMNDLVLQAKGRAIAQQYAADPEMGLQELRAWHGSPHRFARFLTDKVGTGEGYQAFGWGLYFTNKKSIAEWYRDKLSGDDISKVSKNGSRYGAQDVYTDFKEQGLLGQNPDDLYKYWTSIKKAITTLHIQQGDFDRAIAQWEDSSKFLLKEPNSNPTLSEQSQRIADMLKIMRRAGFSVQKNTGALYEVDIPEESEMLDWDSNVNAQTDAVTEKLNVLKEQKEGAPAFDNISAVLNNPRMWKGSQLYDFLVQDLGSPKEASLFLNSLGIKGIKYGAGQISGGVTDGTNYVIFDDAAIEIAQIYDDENILARLRKQEENKEAVGDSSVILPFKGYTTNPKVNTLLDTTYAGISNATKSILRGFRGNLNAQTYQGKSNAVQQYLVLVDALAGTQGLDNTFYPEVFRGLYKNAGAVPDSIRNALDNKPMFLKTLESLRKYYGYNKADLKAFSKQDVLGEAYRLYRIRNKLRDVPTAASEYAKLDSFVSRLPLTTIKSFEYMDLVQAQVKDELNSKGNITKPEELTQGATNNTPPSLPTLFKNIQDIRNLATRERLDTQGIGEAFAVEEPFALGDKRNTVSGGMFGEWNFTPRFIARYSPAFAAVKNAADERREAITGFRHLLFESAKPFFDLPPEQQNYLGDILDQQRRLGKKATVNSQGFLEFFRANPETPEQVERVILKNTTLANAYQVMQKTFETVPTIHRNQLRRSMAPIFAKANLGFNPTKERYENYKTALKNKEVSPDRRLTDAQLSEADQYFDTLDSIERMLGVDYIPHVRFGTRGAVVKDKDGKTVWFGTYSADSDGSPDQDSYEEFLESLNKFKQENPSIKVPSKVQEFDLNMDNLGRQLGVNNKALTLELLTQMLNSSNSKLAKEGLKVDPEELVKGRISNRGFSKHFAEAGKENLQGYSTDWPRVISSYFNSAAYFLGNLENEPKLLTANARLQNSSNASERLKKYSQRLTESILDPEENYATLRELQYFYAMGFNPSSAILQLQSLFTYMPATLTLATNNLFTAYANMAKASKVLPLFFDTSLRAATQTEESMFAFGKSDTHERLVKSGKITRQQSDIIKALYNKGVLQALRSGDMVGVPSDVTTRGLRGKARQKLEGFLAASGVMMRTTEEATRGIQALAAALSLSDPDNLYRLHTNLMENDSLYKQRVNETFTKEPDIVYLTQFLVDKALGEYGKESRSRIQDSVAGVTIMPFSSYPVQMLLNTYEYVAGKYGKNGRLAGLYAIAATGAAAGMLAVPGALMVKELIELTIQQILGEERDLEEELRKWASVKYGDNVTMLATNGLFSNILGADLSSRMAVDVPFATEFLKSLQGEQPLGISDLLGVQGSILESPVKALELAQQENTSLRDILIATIPNVAIQNVLKAQKNREGVTYRKMPSLTPDQGGELDNIVKRGLGFKPLEQGMAEDRINELKRDEKRYAIALERLREPIKKTFKKELLAKTEEEKAQIINERLRLIRNLADFMVNKRLPNVTESINSTLNQARLEAFANLNGLESAAVRKMLRESTRLNFNEISEPYK